MKLAGQDALDYAVKPNRRHWAVLIFGRDLGAVRQTAEAITEKVAPRGGDFALSRLTETDLKADPARLMDELSQQSLLGGDRLVRLRLDTEAQAALVVNALKAFTSPPAARLIVEAGDLASKSALRLAFEQAELAVSLQLYEPDARELAQLARAQLASDKIEIEPAALDVLGEALPRDRLFLKAEIERLALYGMGLGRPIGVADLAELGFAERDTEFDEAADFALAGHVKTGLTCFDRAAGAANSGVGVQAIKALERRCLRLYRARGFVAAGLSPANAAQKLWPPVFRADLVRFEQTLALWPEGALDTALAMILDAERAIKRAGAADVSIAAEVYLRLARRAEQASGRTSARRH